MVENIRFKSEAEQREDSVAEQMASNGGIFYERAMDDETGQELTYVNILGVRVETHASEEEIDEIKQEIILSKLDQRLLRRTAECYVLKQALLFEGDPGAGKTFLFKKFIKMIHGKNAPILEIVGTPRTSELEILGHWAPKGLSEEESSSYQNLLNSFLNSSSGKALSASFDRQLTELTEKMHSGEITEEEYKDQFGQISTDYITEQRNELMSFFQTTNLLKPDVQWEFKEGALLRCYAGNGGRGYPLIVDEFNIIPSNYQQIFLQIGGERGSLSDSISFWGNSGKTVYKRGPDAWIGFASNFPEKTPGRSEVVAPMSDRLVWQVLPAEEYQEKKAAIKRTAGGRLQKRRKELFVQSPEFSPIPVEDPIRWDKVLDEELGEELADIVDILDTEFANYYGEVGDVLKINKDERRRSQQMEFSGRNALRLFSFLDHFQVRDSKTGLIDFTTTLRNAFEIYYLSRLASPQAREKMKKLFEEVLTGSTGKKKFFHSSVGFRAKIKYILTEAGGNDYNFGKDVDKAEIMTREVILRTLVEKCEDPGGKEPKKKENLVAISPNPVMGSALERALGLFDLGQETLVLDFNLIKIDDARESEAADRVASLAKQIEAVIDSGIVIPIIILSWSALDKLLTRDYTKKLKDLFENNGNLKLVRQPVELVQLIKVQQEAVEWIKNNPAKTK